MLELRRDIRDVVNRCERDFNGFFSLRFLEKDGGVEDQHFLEWERTHLIIAYLNSAISGKRKKGKKRRR